MCMNYACISGYGLTDIVVGVTDSNSTEVAPTPESMTICGSFPGAATKRQVAYDTQMDGQMLKWMERQYLFFGVI